MSVGLVPFDRDRYRRKLRAMEDAELVRTGHTLRELVQTAKLVVSPPGTCEPQWEPRLEDAIAEWRARQARKKLPDAC